MTSHEVDPLRRLLNSISSQLEKEHVESIVLLAKVPDGKRGSMTKGHHVFDYLIKRGDINEDDNDVGFLRELLFRMKPRRSDLIKQVEDFIKRTHNKDAIDIYGELISSCKETGQCESENESVERPGFELKCNCPECSTMCHVLVLVLLVAAVLILSLCWHVDRDDEAEKALRIFVIVVMCVILVATLGHYFWKKNPIGRREYVKFENSSIQGKSTQRFPTSPGSSTPLVDAATQKDGRAVSEARVIKFTTSCESFFAPGTYNSGFGSVSSAEAVEPQDV